MWASVELEEGNVYRNRWMREEFSYKFSCYSGRVRCKLKIILKKQTSIRRKRFEGRLRQVKHFTIGLLHQIRLRVPLTSLISSLVIFVQIRGCAATRRQLSIETTHLGK